VNATERFKEERTQLGLYCQIERQRSRTLFSDLKKRFESFPLADLDKVMLAYSGFIAGIALVSLTPHTSTNLQVVFGSLAFWTGAACYLRKRRNATSARQG